MRKSILKAPLHYLNRLFVGSILTILFAQCNNSGKQAAETKDQVPSPVNYSLSSDLPAAPASEAIELSTIPLPDNVYDAKMVNYLPDYKHLIVQVRFKDDMTTNLAVMKEDGSDFKCLTCDLDEEIGGEMPVPLPDGKTVYTPTGILE
ncbi:hypothetical protein [Hymenobacter sp. B1770]|uniref:hypothetical protein n=1 Tax=Hymenobacter sp. B1770 TaxID=1718788 RepID=UPI003CEEF65D